MVQIHLPGPTLEGRYMKVVLYNGEGNPIKTWALTCPTCCLPLLEPVYDSKFDELQLFRCKNRHCLKGVSLAEMGISL